MTKVRRATVADLEIMIEMGRALHDESPRYRDKPYSPEKLRRLFHSMQGSLLAESAAFLVAERDGAVIGMTVAIAADRWFNDERYVSDLTLYVRPECRGSSAFARLVSAIEQWALEQGIADLALGVSTEIHPDKTVRAYQRRGYQLAGYTMVKRHGN